LAAVAPGRCRPRRPRRRLTPGVRLERVPVHDSVVAAGGHLHSAACDSGRQVPIVAPEPVNEYENLPRILVVQGCGGPRHSQSAWTCPRPVDTPDVGVSPRGGSPNGEAGGGERGTPTAAPVVHAGVQGRGDRLGGPGRAIAAGDLSRAR